MFNSEGSGIFIAQDVMGGKRKGAAIDKSDLHHKALLTSHLFFIIYCNYFTFFFFSFGLDLLTLSPRNMF